MGLTSSSLASYLKATCKTCDPECAKFISEYIAKNKEFSKFAKRLKKNKEVIKEYVAMEDRLVEDFVTHPVYRKCLNSHLECLRKDCGEGYEVLKSKVEKLLRDYYIVRQMDKAMKQPQDDKMVMIVRSLEYTARKLDIDTKELSKQAHQYMKDLKK